MRWFLLVAMGPLVWVGCVTSIDDVEKKQGTGGAAGASSGGVGGGTGGSSGGSGNTGGSGGGGGRGGVGGSTGGTGNSGGSGGVDAGTTGGTAGMTLDGGGAVGALGGTGSVDVYATVADCIDTTNPDPDLCESLMGKYQMVVDQQNSAMIGASGAGGGPPTAVFVRFDLGKELAQKTIVSAQYEMTITDYTNSGSSSSGQVYEVSEFTRPDLFVSTPTQIGSVIGANQGTVSTLETVTWQLPVSTPATKEVLCLGVFSTNNDGAYYYNALGATPPRLRINYE